MIQIFMWMTKGPTNPKTVIEYILEQNQRIWNNSWQYVKLYCYFSKSIKT